MTYEVEAVQNYLNSNFMVVAAKGERSIPHIYAAAQLDFNQINQEVDKFSGVKLFRLSSQHMECAYFKGNGLDALVLSAKAGEILKDPDIFNQSVGSVVNYELCALGTEHDLAKVAVYDHETFCGVCVAYNWSLALLNDIELDESFALQAKQSFVHLLNNHKKLVGGNPFPAGKHLEFFSWIYYVELRAIKEIFGTSARLSIHDVATNSAHLPLLLNCSTENDLMGLKFDSIACSDLYTDYPQHSIDNILSERSEAEKKISLHRIDLTQEHPILAEADVIIANDILEHFDEATSFKVLQNIWSQTRDVLLIHVPFEEVPSEIYGHFTSFNKEKLANWAAKLENCENITAKYAYVAQESYDPNFIDYCLFLRRKAN